MRDVDEILDRAARAAEWVTIPADRYERLLRIRDRRQRERRIAAAVLAIVLAAASIAALARVLGEGAQPADRNGSLPEVITTDARDLVAVNPETGHSRILVKNGAGAARTGGVDHAAWSSDGRWLAYTFFGVDSKNGLSGARRGRASLAGWRSTSRPGPGRPPRRSSLS